jgi:hypothetical protein
MIQNYTIIYQNEIENLAKFAHFENFILIILQWLTQKSDILKQLCVFFNNKLQKLDH